MIDMTGNRASPSQGISRHFLVGRVWRISSAEFLRAPCGQNIADLISPQRRHFFSPLINGFASNAKRLREFPHVVSKFLNGVFSSHGHYSKHASDC